MAGKHCYLQYLHAFVCEIYSTPAYLHAETLLFTMLPRSGSLQDSSAPLSSAQLSSAQHSTAQLSSAQRSSAQLSTAQHSPARLSTAQHSSAQLSLTRSPGWGTRTDISILSPERLPGSPKRLQEAPKRPQEAPKKPPGSPKRPPRGSQEAPKLFPRSFRERPEETATNMPEDSNPRQRRRRRRRHRCPPSGSAAPAVRPSQ